MSRKKKTTRKRSKRKRPSRRSRIAAWSAAFLFLTGGAIAALFLFQGERRTLAPSQPAYEEVHSRLPALQEEIGRIDRAVYDVLYRWGIYESDILFTDVGHRIEDGDTWDFTEITVHLPDDEIRRRVGTELRVELEELEPAVTFRRDEENRGEAGYRVHARGRYTHRIRLLLPGPPKPPPARRLPRVAIIIDDLGYDRALARAFASLDIPVSLSVLPMAPRTADVAAEAGRKGRELMLHLPMEPKGYPELNPGPGALLNNMGRKEILDLVARHVGQVPGARGVNNHMGSSFTELEDKVTVVMEELSREGLFFVDSKTTGRSVAYSLACKMGVPAASRSVFLDNEPTSRSIGIQVERLLGIARHRGTAVGIAHPFPGTLKALKEEGARLRNAVEIVTVSEVVE
ncbi:MAG: divergent polysaccharide deacetylase family protein [Deltaproteobacteria bacterium]|nr:divergent polysaccharide deacetylase family protein [Deltaproteobacteria bacterium]